MDIFYAVYAMTAKVNFWIYLSQPVFTCPKLKLETLEQDVKYVQSWQ